MAVREGFEPSIRCRIHTFQACSFSHSDTSPLLNSCLGVSSSPFNRAVRWLRRTLCVLFVSSASQTGQPLGHLTVVELLFRREFITFQSIHGLRAGYTRSHTLTGQRGGNLWERAPWVNQFSVSIVIKTLLAQRVSRLACCFSQARTRL
jgi:hypothetical protein